MKRKTAGLVLSLCCLGGLSSCDLLRTIVQQSQPTPQPTDSNQANGNTVPAQGNNSGPTGRLAVLAGLPAGSKVSIRSQAAPQASVVAYGTVGDQVYVQQQQQSNDGSTWYFIQYANSNTQGWVNANRLQFSNSPPSNNSGTPISLDTALSRCRQQAQTEFPNANIQVSQGWVDMNGRYVVNWSADTGDSGTCTIDRSGWVVSFVNSNQNNNPSNGAITPAALNGCANRAARDLNVYPASVSVQSSTSYADGTFGVNWWTSNGRSGFCRVTSGGNVLSFIINDRPSPQQRALERCKRRAEQELPGSQIQVYLDPRSSGNSLRVIWSANTGQDGYCRADQDGNIIEFVNSQNGSGSFRCVGNIFGDTEFRAFYDNRQFGRIEFRDRQPDNRYTVNLQPAGQNNQGQPIYQGTEYDGPSSVITLTDLSGGNPYSGSQISLFYNGTSARGTCRSPVRN